jgi:short-subunit dehydrogenase
MSAPRSILITGASSGIGEALALAYAAPGVTLFLSGRDEPRLAAVAAACRGKGAEVETHLGCVSEATAMTEWIAGADARSPLDLVIANAGVSAGTGSNANGETAEQARRIWEINLGGVMNTVLPAIPLMRARKRGQIAIVSSLAGFRGLPGAPSYSASKGAVRLWGEGLRGWLAEDGIGLSVICPGFVKSRITALNRFPMPFLIEADRAAEIIRRGLAANKGRIAFPWPMYAATWLFALLPVALTDWLAARLPKKG